MPISSFESTHGRTSIFRASGPMIRTGRRKGAGLRAAGRPAPHLMTAIVTTAKRARVSYSWPGQLHVDACVETVVQGGAGEAGDSRLHHAEHRQRAGQLDDQGRLGDGASLDRFRACPAQHRRSGSRAGTAPGRSLAARDPDDGFIPLQDPKAHGRLDIPRDQHDIAQNHNRRH